MNYTKKVWALEHLENNTYLHHLRAVCWLYGSCGGCLLMIAKSVVGLLNCISKAQEGDSWSFLQRANLWTLWTQGSRHNPLLPQTDDLWTLRIDDMVSTIFDPCSVLTNPTWLRRGWPMVARMAGEDPKPFKKPEMYVMHPVPPARPSIRAIKGADDG